MRGAPTYSGGEGGSIFETMHTVLKLHLESGSYGSETSFRRNTINWLGVTLDMKPVDHYMIDDVNNIGLQPRGFYKVIIKQMCYSIDEELEDSELFQSVEVFDRAYNSVIPKDMASQQTHLNKNKQVNPENVLAKYSKKN